MIAQQFIDFLNQVYHAINWYYNRIINWRKSECLSTDDLNEMQEIDNADEFWFWWLTNRTKIITNLNVRHYLLYIIIYLYESCDWTKAQISTSKTKYRKKKCENDSNAKRNNTTLIFQIIQRAQDKWSFNNLNYRNLWIRKRQKE